MDGSDPLLEATPENPRRFRIHRCLGRGGFGEVYRATMWREEGVAAEVAVKVLAADVALESDAVRRLRDEGKLLGALDHPVILKVYDLVLLAGRVALVTEYVEGQDLHRCLDAPDTMPLRAVVETVGHTAEALHAAWTTPAPDGDGPMHLVHRDVKPQNIRIGVHGQVKLLDFGIARAANVFPRESKTQTNMMMGSWPYLAPERLREDSHEEVGPPIDVYALGCTLFEGVSGERLTEGLTLLDLYRHVDEEGGIERLVEARLGPITDGTPPAVVALLRRLLAPDPRQRPSPAELAQACDALAESLPGAGLRRWARARDWPPPVEHDGPLTNLEIAEGSTALPVGRAPPPPPNLRTVEPVEARGRVPTVPPGPRLGSTPAPSAEHTTPLEIPRAAARAPPGNLLAIRIDEPDAGPAPAPQAKPRPRRRMRWAFLAVGVFVLGFAGLALAAVAAMWLAQPGARDMVVELDEEGKGVEEVVDEPEVEVPAPAPAPAPAPVPVAVPAPAPAPAPVQADIPRPPPPPRPEPTEPEITPGTPGTLVVDGDAVAVELQGEFGGFRAGTPLIPGPYDVWADFGSGLADAGVKVVVRPGARVTVRCTTETNACTAE